MRRAESLTGMRFIAAALVFFHHVIWFNVFADQGIVDGYHDVFINAGRVGVAFFFVLSGFVLTLSARPDDTRPRFWRRRAAKIYPNHLVTAVLALGIFAIVDWRDQGWHVIPNLLLVQTWWPDYNLIFSVNPVSWSLACELVFYLSFPFLYAAVARIRQDRLWWFAGMTAALVIAVPFIAQTLLPSTPGVPDGQPAGMYQFWFVYVFPPVRLLDFLLGILLARIVQSGQWIRLRPPAALAVCLGAYMLSMNVPYLYALNAVMVPPLALLVASVAAADLRGERSWLAGRAMTRLGEASYAFYMVHMLVMMLGVHVVSSRVFGLPAALGVMAAWFLISLLCASALYTFVERPLTRRLGRPRVHQPRADPLPASSSS